MSEVKQYAERDLMAMDIAGNHYCRHVDHMTREQLHSKSDIAAELGWRDMQIAKLTAQRDSLAADCGPSVQSADLKALMRFNETSDDGEGYDIGDDAMDRLVELGLVAKERGKMRIITSFGMWVIARENGEQNGVLETQRDRDLAFQQRLAQLRAGEPS